MTSIQVTTYHGESIDFSVRWTYIQILACLLTILILSMPESKASSEVNIFYIHCIGEQEGAKVHDKLLKFVFISFLMMPPYFCIR